MFCSSLRRKREWAPALHSLLASKWKETKLETHDISFPVKIQGGIAVFRGILVFPKDVGTSQTKERLERLRLLDGGRSVFVVLLLDGDSSMASLTKLQMETPHTADVPIIPILSATDLPLCLDNLRKQCSVGTDHNNRHGGTSKRELLSHCVSGLALSERQTNILTDISADFDDLMRSTFIPDRQGVLYDLLGDEDARRLVSYLVDGPTRNQG